MRKAQQANVVALRAQRETSDRRKIANQMSRAIRLGRLVLEYGHVHELEGHEHPCWYCKRRGRVFWVSWWEALSERAQHLGFIHASPYMCAVCLWQRFARPGERLHELGKTSDAGTTLGKPTKEAIQ